MIKSLLDYQAKEREKIALLLSVEQGKAKREINECTRVIESGKRTLLSLESDAKALLSTYESVSKNLNEIFEKIAIYNKNAKESETEEEASGALSFVSGLLSKVSAYETQLSDLTRKIQEKTAAFEDLKVAIGRAQSSIKTAQEQYDKLRAETQPKVAAIEAELAKLAAAVSPALLDKYRVARSKVSGDRDIVVKLVGNLCGGCRYELPLSQTHKIAANGYITCEECGRIIYK